MFFDTHAHYDDQRFDGLRDGLLSGMPQRGVSLILNASASLASSRQSIALAGRYPFVYASAGVHPQECGDMTDADMDELSALLHAPKVVAIGEIGLDYYYDTPPKSVQRHWFERQLALAGQKNLPVIVHDREAHADALDAVKRHPGLKGVFHCYSGSVEMAMELVELGYYLSFTGTVTFKNARRAPEVLRVLPLERIMIETDAPYLAPEPFRGKQNHSGYVYRVAEVIAELRGLSVERVAELTMENGCRLFGITDPRLKP